MHINQQTPEHKSNTTGTHIADGVHYELPFNDYLNIDAVSCSYLKRISEGKAKAQVPRQDSPAMFFGRALHSYILTPDLFDREFAVAPLIHDRRTKEGKELWARFQAKHKDSRVILTAHEFSKIVSMGASISMHPIGRAMIDSDGCREVSMTWVDTATGLNCKCRCDGLIPKKTVWDVKSVKDASPRGFRYAVYKYMWHMQGAMYMQGVGIATGEPVKEFVFIAVEKEPPYMVGIYKLDKMMLAEGEFHMSRLMLDEKKCRDEEYYPAYYSEHVIEIGLN